MSGPAGALVRGDGGAPPSQPSSDPSHEGYRALRGSEQRVPNAYTLAEVALRTAPGLGRDAATPADGVSALAALLSQVPEPLRGKAVRLDLDRIERAVDYLERWWRFLAGLEVDGVELTPRKAREMKIAAMVKSRFFKVLLDESAPMRFALEARVLAEMFPDHSDEAASLRGRLESLSVRARQTATELLLRRADDAWADTLKGAEGVGS